MKLSLEKKPWKEKEKMLKRINKRGQLGKLIASVPIMILLFVIMGLFVLLSAGFSISKVGSKLGGGVENQIDIGAQTGWDLLKDKIPGIQPDDLMLKPIIVEKKIGEGLVLYNFYDFIAVNAGKINSNLILSRALSRNMLNLFEKDDILESAESICLAVGEKTGSRPSEEDFDFCDRNTRGRIYSKQKGTTWSDVCGSLKAARIFKLDNLVKLSDGQEVEDWIGYYYGRCSSK